MHRNLKPQEGFAIRTARLYTKNGKEIGYPNPYICSLCNFILRDPFQLLECGCRYCQPCLEKLLERPDPRCVVDEEPIKQDEYRLDKGCLKDINSFIADCIGKPNGCTWKGNLVDFEIHIDECPFIEISCDNKCGQKFLRSELSKHEANCPKINIPKPFVSGSLAQFKFQGCQFEGNETESMEKEMDGYKQQVRFLQEEVGSTRTESDSGHYSHSRLRGIHGEMGSSMGFAYSSRDDFMSLVLRVHQLEQEMRCIKPGLEDAKSEMNLQRLKLAGYINTVQTLQESVTRHAANMEEIKLRQEILDVKTVSGVFIWKTPYIAAKYPSVGQVACHGWHSKPYKEPLKLRNRDIDHSFTSEFLSQHSTQSSESSLHSTARFHTESSLSHCTEKDSMSRVCHCVLGIKDHSEVFNLCKIFSKDWKYIGSKLCIEVGILQAIKKDCDDVKEMMFEMIASWLRRESEDQPKPSWNILLTTLNEFDRGETEKFSSQFKCHHDLNH